MNRRRSLGFALLAVLPVAAALAQGAPQPDVSLAPGHDYHSFADPGQLRVRHLELDLQVDFGSRRLSGVVDLEIERAGDEARMLVLDTRDLIVRKVWLLRDGQPVAPLRFELGERDPILGQALRIELPPATEVAQPALRISYQTRPGASGLQWLEPAQTADKSAPFLFSQSQAIHARSWVPLQDTPQVRFTYNAALHVPQGLRALMSAHNDPRMPADGVFRFEMRQPIPSYLLALAVGRLEFRALGARSGVYAEPTVIEAAARELEDTEKMLMACESLFGAYRWGRYDVLILPPSFPYGGMENPHLTFATPTILAGDKSLIGLIAHELAHSWSGNLVTNATWRDFWLNEGFTTFLERRIVEALYGPRRRAMEAVLGLQTLRGELARYPPGDTVLALDLRGRDPDDHPPELPYEKGALFLEWLQSSVGRESFDAFLRGYFEHFAFRSVTTEQLEAWLGEHLIAQHPDRVSAAEVRRWLYEPGLPDSAVLPHSDAFEKIDALRSAWLEEGMSAQQLPGREWTTHEWLHFLENLPPLLPAAKLAELDAAWQLTAAGNAEIAHSWLKLAIRHEYKPAYARLENYLTHIGRRKLIRPLYEELMKTPRGRASAREIYARARPGYHPIAVATLDGIVR